MGVGVARAQVTAGSSNNEIDNTAVVLPTLTPVGDHATATKPRRPLPSDGPLLDRARELDGILRDTVQDLGLTVDLSRIQDGSIIDVSERSLIAQAARSKQWILSPRIELESGGIATRLMLVPAGGGYAIVRAETIMPEEFQLRVVVMLRDLVAVARGGSVTGSAAGVVEPRDYVEDDQGALSTVSGRRAEGRAVLAANAALFGGYIGYSLQRFAGSDDVRLTYPLVALGSGAGLGISLIVAQEWNIGLGEAWFLSASAWWPTFGAFMLANARGIEPDSDRHVWGICGGFGGIALASLNISLGRATMSDAAVAHSGGLIGTVLGAGTELVVRGRTDVAPLDGIGYGAIGGVVAGGVLGHWIKPTPARAVMIDLGAGLGGLSVAAVASPLLIGDAAESRQRAWLLLTMSGAVAGGVATYLFTTGGSSRSRPGAVSSGGVLDPESLPFGVVPHAGVIASSMRSDGAKLPVFGAGFAGSF